MDDQIIDAVMARSLRAVACRAHPLVGWIVMRDPPDYPDRFMARLMTAADRQPAQLRLPRPSQADKRESG
jgi:hypothetical protein